LPKEGFGDAFCGIDGGGLDLKEDVVACEVRPVCREGYSREITPYPCKHKYNKSVNLLNCRPFLYVVGVSVHGNLGEKRRVSENQKSNIVYKDIGASLPARGS
jgi:hypothetical protein